MPLPSTPLEQDVVWVAGAAVAPAKLGGLSNSSGPGVLPSMNRLRETGTEAFSVTAAPTTLTRANAGVGDGCKTILSSRGACASNQVTPARNRLRNVAIKRCRIDFIQNWEGNACGLCPSRRPGGFEVIY